MVYDKHPSIYHAALKLDLYPNEISIVNMDEILNKEVHPDQLKGKNILIYYNFEMKEKKKVQKKFEEYRENHNFKMEAFDFLINN